MQYPTVRMPAGARALCATALVTVGLLWLLGPALAGADDNAQKKAAAKGSTSPSDKPARACVPWQAAFNRTVRKRGCLRWKAADADEHPALTKAFEAAAEAMALRRPACGAKVPEYKDWMQGPFFAWSREKGARIEKASAALEEAAKGSESATVMALASKGALYEELTRQFVGAPRPATAKTRKDIASYKRGMLSGTKLWIAAAEKAYAQCIDGSAKAGAQAKRWGRFCRARKAALSRLNAKTVRPQGRCPKRRAGGGKAKAHNATPGKPQKKKQ